MEEMSSNHDLTRLFSKLCCSNCKEDFDADSITLMRNDGELSVVQIKCTKCDKSFGLAFLGLNEDELKRSITNKPDYPLEIQKGPPPISYDDVIEAHNFIESLDENWKQYIPDDFKK